MYKRQVLSCASNPLPTEYKLIESTVQPDKKLIVDTLAIWNKSRVCLLYTSMHDPDAEIAGLTLTVPSWVRSIERARNNADMNAASTSAKSKLEEALLSLQEKVSEMLSEIREVD